MIKKRSRAIERTAVILFAIAFSVLNSLEVIVQWIKNPPDRIFTGISHFFADYFLYVSQFSEGARGSWIFARLLFTNEPMQKTWIYWFNVTLGHMGSIVGLSPFASYNVSLMILVFFLILLWHRVSTLLYPTDRLSRWTSFIFITTASSFFDGKSFLGQFWFSPGLAFNRLGGVPHQVFQTILFLLLITSKNRLALVGLSFLAGTANPVQMLIFLIAWSITTIVLQPKKPLPLLIVILFGGLGAWLTNLEFSKQTVFAAAKAWELSQHVPTGLFTLLLTVGPIIILVPFGLGRYLKKLSPLRFLFLMYGTLAIVLFLSPIPRLLGVSPSRFLNPAPYAVLAILATEGMNKKFVLLLIYLFLTIPALYHQGIDRITPYRNPLLLMDTMYNHVPVKTVEGLRFLATLPPAENAPVVLTDPHYPIEVLVPVFSGKISFSGHPIHTLYPNEKEALRQRFFGGNMNTEEAKIFLTNHRVGYIIAAPNANLPFPFLSKVYQNKEMVIFSIQPE